MKCPSDAVLRAFADNELEHLDSKIVEQHVVSCRRCSLRSKELIASAQQVSGLLRELALDPSHASVAGSAYAQFRSRYAARLEGRRPSWLRPLVEGWRYRPVWGVLAAACLLALLVSFAPTRTWAQRFLQMLRVEKLAVVPVDLSPSTFSPDAIDRSRGKLITQLISDNVIVTMKPDAPVRLETVAEARERAGFPVRTLEALGAPTQIFAGDQGAFHVTLDRDRIQAVLDQAGRSDVQLPASVDGATVAVHLPKSVRLLYGTCSQTDLPPPVANPAGSAPQDDGGSCIELLQAPSPVVSVPHGLDVQALAEAGLQIAGLSAAEAHAFCRTVDWTSTLVIPIPRNGSTFRTLPVDGVQGTLAQLPARGGFADRYTIIWVKNGMLYSVEGKGSPDRALSAVDSLN